jgi:hypothetical protein
MLFELILTAIVVIVGITQVALSVAVEVGLIGIRDVHAVITAVVHAIAIAVAPRSRCHFDGELTALRGCRVGDDDAMTPG